MKLFTTMLLVIIFTAGVFAQSSNDLNVFRLAQSFEQQGDFERAADLYSDLFKRDTNNYQYFDALRRLFVQLKRYDEAISISKRRLRSTPYDFNLQANIGALYVIAGKEKQADSVWNGILASAMKNQMFYRAVAAEQGNQRLFDKAIGTYLRGRREIGDQYIFANELGYLYSFMMDYENSVREYLLLLRQNEQQYDFIQSRFSSIVTKPDGLKAAIKVIGAEIVQKETIPLLRLQMWLFMEDDQYGKAFDVAMRIEQLLNSNGVEMFQFAERLVRESEFRVAANAFQIALGRNLPPQNIPAARYGYARCIEEISINGDSTAEERSNPDATMLETQPVFSSAIGLYASLVKEYPYSITGANALYRIGWIRYKHLSDLDGALQMFDSVLVISPAGPMISSVLSTIGEIYVSQNKLDRAEEKYGVMARSPYSGTDQKNLARYRLAEIQFFKNSFDSALSVLLPLTQNLKADETNDALILQYFITENKLQFPDALKKYARAELLFRRNKASESVQELLSIVDLYPTAPLSDDALLHAADRMVLMKRYQDALQTYNKLLEEYKTSNEKEKTYFRIGELYQYHLRDSGKAIQSYEIILEKYPFSLFVDEARMRIRILRGDAI